MARSRWLAAAVFLFMATYSIAPVKSCLLSCASASPPFHPAAARLSIPAGFSYLPSTDKSDACGHTAFDGVTVFRGGSTAGTPIVMRLDMRGGMYQLDSGTSAAAPPDDDDADEGVSSGRILTSTRDCTLLLRGPNGERRARIAVNRDGMLLGMLDNGKQPPVSIIAFRDTAAGLDALSGIWRVIATAPGSTAQPASATQQPARPADRTRIVRQMDIDAEGGYRVCTLSRATPAQCSDRAAKISARSGMFEISGAQAQRRLIVVGRVGNRRVPVLLDPGSKDGERESMQFLVPEPTALAASTTTDDAPAPRAGFAQARAIQPVFRF